MDTVSAPCLRCARPIPVDATQDTPGELRCGHCHAKQVQAIYPTAFRKLAEINPTPTTETGSSCYFHEQSEASSLCDDCGRYLCDLCTLPIPMPANNPTDFPKRLCPACFENRVALEEKEMQWDLFRTIYPRYDVIAGVLIVAPILLFPLSFLSLFTLPAAVFILIRNWRHNRTPVERFRRSMVITLCVGIIGIAFWLFVFAIAITENL